MNKLASEIAAEEEGWAFVNVNVRPYYAEGSKTLAYEIAEQLGWRLPDQVVIPVASGSQLTKIDKGFTELITLGLVEPKPYTIFGAQATGCSPVAPGLPRRPRRGPAGEAGHHRQVAGDRQPGRRAVRAGRGPADRWCDRRRGRRRRWCENIQRLARTEGIFAETAGGVTVGVTAKLIADGLLDPAGDRGDQLRRRAEDARRGRR